MRDYDAIVVGSGAGGLTAALCLARAGKRVAVLEQHYLPGGWCHSFSLEGFQFSPGVHYIGGLEPGGPMRKLYEGLGVANDLVFLELNPDGYDHIRVGQERFDIPRGLEQYTQRLCQRFPAEADGIRRYLKLTAAVGRELESGISVRGLKEALSLPLRLPNTLRYGMRTLDSVLDDFVKDPMLRAILSMQAGDHGVAPSKVPFLMHAAVTAHYYQGAWYPMGGAKSLPRAFIRALRKHGGRIMMRTRVERILVEKDAGGALRAVGVRLADGKELRSDVVISNADPHATFDRMLDPEHLPTLLKMRLAATRYSVSGLSLFMAAKMDARAEGLDSGNIWYTQTPRIEETYDYARLADPLSRPVPGVFLTAPTLKDPSKRKDDLHTFESFTFISPDAFRRFEGSQHEQRPAEYQAFKQRLTAHMMARVEELVPGLGSKLVFQELGTPLTNVHYVNASRGNLYGTDKNRFQIGPLSFGIKTHIKGLLCCGASTLGHGVAGASISGVVAAQVALKARASALLNATGQSLLTLPAEDTSVWPAHLRNQKAGDEDVEEGTEAEHAVA